MGYSLLVVSSIFTFFALSGRVALRAFGLNPDSTPYRVVIVILFIFPVGSTVCVTVVCLTLQVC